ncbi:tagaturonate reductase [Paenibacillus lautus]|uniref:tagaturonate reductase n=1 Tax=Paenibacillus lautus TaxID=1401 RepID=UPI003D279E7E
MEAKTDRDRALKWIGRDFLQLQQQNHLEMLNYPVKVLQIGEGNFLRGFFDWMIYECNRQGLFQGSVAVSQPRPGGRRKLEQLREQEGIYGLLTRGLQDGRKIEEERFIPVFSKIIDPYAEWEHFLSVAELDSLEIVVSNTTEAGLDYQRSDWNPSEPPMSFPAKLTLLLYRRYERYEGSPDKGLLILPCELLERNGDILRSIVLRHAEDWELSSAFRNWVKECNLFLNSLVDRIVTGYPEEAERYFDKWGYEDRLLNTAEPYYFWAIEGDPSLESRLPLQSAGLQVRWVPDLTPYQVRKVRILNGTHTLMASIGLLHGFTEVKEIAESTEWGEEIRSAMLQEIVPLVPLPREEVTAYAETVWERFRNPFLRHKLQDIAMNSFSKFKVRLLPSLKEYVSSHNTLPSLMTRGLASLIRLYHAKPIEGQWYGMRLDGEEVLLRDDPDSLMTFYQAWQKVEDGEWSIRQLVASIFGNQTLWGEDLNRISNLHEVVSSYIEEMELIET